MSKRRFRKQGQNETFYRERLLPFGEEWTRGALTNNFKYLSKDFIREMKDYIDWNLVYWYVVTNNDLKSEFLDLCFIKK